MGRGEGRGRFEVQSLRGGHKPISRGSIQDSTGKARTGLAAAYRHRSATLNASGRGVCRAERGR